MNLFTEIAGLQLRLMTQMDVREQLITAKKKLIQALGPNEKAYWANMKAWFKQQISKEEFDRISRKLLSAENTHLHNNFFFAVLSKCQISPAGKGFGQGSNQATKNKNIKRMQAIKRKHDNRFVAAEPNPNVISIGSLDVKRSKLVTQSVSSCSKTLNIPTAEDLSGLSSVISWETGLDDVSEEAVELAAASAKVFLKNLLTAILSRRSAHQQIPGNNTFKYAFGSEPPNPYLLKKPSSHSNTSISRPSYEEAEQRAIEDLGRTDQNSCRKKSPISSQDLLHCLKYYRYSVIPSHTVYSFAVERVSCSMWHPTSSELEQERVYKTAMSTAKTKT